MNIPIETIRNITLKDSSGDENQCAAILEQIQKDNIHSATHG